jgi:hypothetical protein
MRPCNTSWVSSRNVSCRSTSRRTTWRSEMPRPDGPWRHDMTRRWAASLCATASQVGMRRDVQRSCIAAIVRYDAPAGDGMWKAALGSMRSCYDFYITTTVVDNRLYMPIQPKITRNHYENRIRRRSCQSMGRDRRSRGIPPFCGVEVRPVINCVVPHETMGRRNDARSCNLGNNSHESRSLAAWAFRSRSGQHGRLSGLYRRLCTNLRGGGRDLSDSCDHCLAVRLSWNSTRSTRVVLRDRGGATKENYREPSIMDW